VSASAEDEARARLEVAQLYEEMGQTDKAVRYLLSAAEILRSGGLVTRARELYQRILKLEPSNQAAQNAMNAILGAGAAPAAGAPAPGARPAQVAGPNAGGPPPAGGTSGAPVPVAPAPTPAPVQAAARPDGQPGVMVPTPLLYRDARMIAAVRGQINGPPDYALFPYDPLPRVDPAVLAARADARRKAEEAARQKANPRVASSFGGPGGGYTSNRTPVSEGFAGAKSSGPSSKFGGGAAKGPAAPTPAARVTSGEIRGGNRDLADQIARRLKESDNKKPQR
jgi:hypothetical protein